MTASSIARRLLGALPPIAIVAVAVLGFRLLVRTGPETPQRPPPEAVTLVETRALERESRRMTVRAVGSAEAADAVALQPEVSGRVDWISPSFEPGARIAQGEPLLRIDDRVYQSAVARSRAALRRAEVALALERSRQHTAVEEWDLLEREARDQETRALALREPQLAAARADLESARRALEQAEQDLERTRVGAPFDAVILERNASVGQWVSPQAAVARLAGSDRRWLRAALPMRELAWFDLPDDRGRGGARAALRQVLGDGEVLQWTGRVIRLLGDLSEGGRMARALIEIDPSGRERLPLPLIGSWLEAEIEGHLSNDLFVLPEKAVHEGRVVWLMDEEDRLELRTVGILRSENGEALVREGLEEGERLVTSRIPVPIRGMKLKEADQTPPPGEDRPDA
jgi:RND family efflux transporter MFP subunit